MAGAWAATTDRSKVVTLYDALVRKGLEVNYAEGYDMKSNQLTGLQEALQAAEASDVIVVAVGERFGQSGEKASKVNIAIPEGAAEAGVGTGKDWKTCHCSCHVWASGNLQ